MWRGVHAPSIDIMYDKGNQRKAVFFWLSHILENYSFDFNTFPFVMETQNFRMDK